MRIRNSFPYWYSGYSADEAAIVMVVPPGQLPELVKKLQKTRVMDIIAYTVSSQRLEYANDLLQPAGVRPASLVTTVSATRRSRLVTVTLTPGRVAPEGSVMVPAMLPYTA